VLALKASPSRLMGPWSPSPWDGLQFVNTPYGVLRSVDWLSVCNTTLLFIFTTRVPSILSSLLFSNPVSSLVTSPLQNIIALATFCRFVRVNSGAPAWCLWFYWILSWRCKSNCSFLVVISECCCCCCCCCCCKFFRPSSAHA
jgi:hypothetical protein